MAYLPQYTANFTNELSQEVLVTIEKKDGEVVNPHNYKVVSLKISDNSDEQDIYACIISKELELVIWTEDNEAITWETFISSAHDDWKVTVTVDGKIFFVGFITPDEGHAPFQDKPYEIVLKATDGLGLLKGYELTDTSSAKFKGFYNLINYLAGALIKTKLDLPIRIYCNIFHKSMLNKGNSMNYDLFNQVELNARTFLKDVNSYESCYDSLKILLSGWCNIQQYDGKWQIVTLAERQYRPGDLYYVDYSYLGTGASGGIDIEDTSVLGKNELIYPINESQTITSGFANKQVKSIFNYIIPEDLVNNQKLQQLGNFITPVNAYEIVGWTHYKGQPQTGTTNSQTLSSVKSYIKVESDSFGTQTDRYYIVPKDSTAPSTQLENYIRNDNIDFFADKGDQISLSITYRTKFQISSGSNLFIASLILLKDGATGSSQFDWYSVDTNTDHSSFSWLNTPNNTFARYNITENTTEWKTVSFSDLVIPANGTMYLLLGTGNVNTNNEVHFKDIKIELTTYFRGSKFNIKGDYHTNIQNYEFPDNSEQSYKISDSPKRLIKGSFFWTNSSNTRILLTPDFYRYPNTEETKNFKQLANYGKFNHTYRRFYKIEGDFTSIMYNTASDQNLRKPLGFHKRYRFTDMTPQREFVLEPSLEMDLVTGNIRATFVEVYKDSNDGQSTGDVDKFDYIF